MDMAGDQIQGARARQEDSLAWMCLGDCQLAVVADGMGGHPAGDVASRAAIDTFVTSLRATLASDGRDPTTLLEASLRAADKRLHAIEREQPVLTGLGTTLAALLFTPHTVYRASVGDSLIYRRDGDILVRVNDIHGDGPMVSSCLGPALTRLDIAALGPPDQPHLIASDGIEVLREAELTQAVITAETADSAVADLLGRVDTANAVGQDNVSVIVALPRY